jgi:hypothetical protein
LFNYWKGKEYQLIDELTRHKFNLKVESNVNEYLSCCIEEFKDERKLTMIQPNLLTRLIQNFREEIEEKEVPYSWHAKV